MRPIIDLATLEFSGRARLRETARENYLRRAAKRQGLMLRKSRRRDPQALDYGQFWLIDGRTGVHIFGGEWGAGIDEIEAHLAEGDPLAWTDADGNKTYAPNHHRS